MPTQTYVSDNRSNGYGHLNTAQVGSYSYDLFRQTVWSLRIFEGRLRCRTDSRQTDVGMEFLGLGA
jgi:hypothetical protein